jgi:sjoegren syndrome nuclear autoantigen 1
LTQINDALSKKHQARGDYDKIVQETEAAYSKIVESSHTLLNVLKKEATSIARRSLPPGGSPSTEAYA